MDYLLQRALPESISDNILIPSTAMIDIIKILLQKLRSDNEEDIAAYKRICQQYHLFYISTISIGCIHL
jgi:hypothetical protein